MAHFIPVSPDSLELDGIAQNDRFVQAMIMPDQEEEEEPDWLGDGDGEEAAEKHKGEEGQAGKEDSEQSNKELAIKGPADNQDIQLKRSVDTQVAMNSGALAILGDQVSSPFGAADNSVGSDAIHALGNLEGDGVGEAKGFGGLGVAGAGRGGGGISERGIGMATVGTKGKGGRGGGGGQYGRSAGDLGDKKTRVPKLVPGKPQVQGSLDKEIIRRVVRQHRNEIRYCYEKQLQKNPKLSGTVKVKFTISGTGSVISALVSSSSLKDSSVEQCMTSKIRRWVFPEPKGGGIVVVNYPFNFSS
jgi:TonB family protein